MTHCPHTDPCRALAVAALSDPLHIELLMSRPSCSDPCPFTERCRRDTLALIDDPLIVELIMSRPRCGDTEPLICPDRQQYDREGYRAGEHPP